MRRENNGVSFAEVTDEVSYLDYLLGVKTDCRLVENYNRRVSDESLSYADALSVAF